MWFKNLQIYRLPAPWTYLPEKLAADLQAQAFAPAGSNELLRMGWAAPRDDGQLVHVVGRQMLLCLRSEKKLLPASVINQVAKAKADELEEQQGFRPGRKAMKELKERVADELLPRAFSVVANTFVWIDPVNGWLVVDAASPSRADDVVKMLLKAVDRMPLESVRVNHSPVSVMTGWLQSDEAPHGFTIDQDTELQASGESRAKVKYVKHTLEHDDIARHIAAGKQCTRLAMTWNDRVSFMLTETLAIKSVKALDVLKESEAVTYSDMERFDNDFALMAGELARLLADLVEALGGEAHDLVSKAQEDAGERPIIGSDTYAAAKKLHDTLRSEGATMTITVPGKPPVHVGDGPDPLYEQAVTIVRTHQRASISLVQRHLVIGYNRAARLMEAMEAAKVVSPMQPNGNRDLLGPTTIPAALPASHKEGQ